MYQKAKKNIDFKQMLTDRMALIYPTATINQKLCNLFWANKTDLDYAEITYTIYGKIIQLIKLAAKNNKIIYTEAPSKDFSVEHHFVGKKWGNI